MAGTLPPLGYVPFWAPSGHGQCYVPLGYVPFWTPSGHGWYSIPLVCSPLCPRAMLRHSGQ